jgi:hypothetical protein
MFSFGKGDRTSTKMKPGGPFIPGGPGKPLIPLRPKSPSGPCFPSNEERGERKKNTDR